MIPLAAYILSQRGFDAVCYIKVIIVNFIPYHTKPESLDTLNAIHVAGTKGKGSVCAFTESILRRCQIYGVGARSSRTKSSRNVTTGLLEFTK